MDSSRPSRIIKNMSTINPSIIILEGALVIMTLLSKIFAIPEIIT